MSNSLQRKMRRKAERKKRKQQKKNLDSKINLYEGMSEECFVCRADFDKQNKEMINDWYVVVREKEQQVNLYCPTCWQQAKTIIETLDREEKE
jgi:hypothetical protein